MMSQIDIACKGIHKRYLGPWVLKDINLQIPSSSSMGIVGTNGSGKSTLLQIIMGKLSATKGTVTYKSSNQEIDIDNIYKHIAFAAPYAELIRDFTISEQYIHYAKFKEFRSGWSLDLFLDRLNLFEHRNKKIKYLSSGLNQRLKLGLAILSDCSILVLDEPTSYLDKENKALFKSLLQEYKEDRTLIIASNDEFDLEQCDLRFDVKSNREVH